MHELRRQRRARGLSVKEVAEAIGVSPNTIYSWEIGRRHPTSQNLQEWQRALLPNGDAPDVAGIVANARHEPAFHARYATKPVVRESNWITNEYHVSYETAYRIHHLLSACTNGEVTMRISIPPNEPR